jgi:hypothetical protein
MFFCLAAQQHLCARFTFHRLPFLTQLDFTLVRWPSTILASIKTPGARNLSTRGIIKGFRLCPSRWCAAVCVGAPLLMMRATRHGWPNFMLVSKVKDDVLSFGYWRRVPEERKSHYPLHSFFSAVFSPAIDADAPHLSGPGRRLQLHDVINVGTPGEISDESHASLRRNLSPLAFDSQYRPPPELNRSPEAYGYPFHSACWHLLSAYGSLTPSDIHLLFNLCQSCPIQHGLLNWGHGYGALFDIWAYDYGGI